MNDKVAVLAVMDVDIRRAEERGNIERSDRLQAVRAAVAELIDRVDAYQSARKLMDDAMVDGINVQGALSGYMFAEVMLNAALARVKGE